MLPGLMLPATVPGAHLPADVSTRFAYSVLELHMSRFQQSMREASMRQSKLQAGLAEQRAKVAELTESARVSATRTEEHQLASETNEGEKLRAQVAQLLQKIELGQNSNDLLTESLNSVKNELAEKERENEGLQQRIEDGAGMDLMSLTEILKSAQNELAEKERQNEGDQHRILHEADMAVQDDYHTMYNEEELKASDDGVSGESHPDNPVSDLNQAAVDLFAEIELDETNEALQTGGPLFPANLNNKDPKLLSRKIKTWGRGLKPFMSKALPGESNGSTSEWSSTDQSTDETDDEGAYGTGREYDESSEGSDAESIEEETNE